jgi:hypothetical protein
MSSVALHSTRFLEVPGDATAAGVEGFPRAIRAALETRRKTLVFNKL